jgi:hypothetical protein
MIPVTPFFALYGKPKPNVLEISRLFLGIQRNLHETFFHAALAINALCMLLEF